MVAERVRKALRSRRLEERVAGVEALGRIGAPEATPLLVAALCDRSHYVAALAARILGEQGDAEAAPAMIDRFAWLAVEGKARDPGCRIRAELTLALGKLEDRRATEALLAGIQTVQIEPDGPGFSDMATGLRGNCALALAQIRPPEALLAISLLLFDAGGSDKVSPSKAAAEALGRLGDPAGVIPLAVCLVHGRGVLRFPESAVADVLVACMDAVVALEAPEALSLLAPFLGVGGADEDSMVAWRDARARAYLCASAGLALARTRHPEALPLLTECLGAGPEAALEATAIALASLRSEDARAALVAAAGHRRGETRAAAVAGLALFPDDETTALLRRLAERDADPAVRKAAAGALAGRS